MSTPTKVELTTTVSMHALFSAAFEMAEKIEPGEASHYWADLLSQASLIVRDKANETSRSPQ